MAPRDLRRPAANTLPGGRAEQDTPLPTGGSDPGSRRRFLRRAAVGSAVAVGATSLPLAFAPAALAQSGGSTGSAPGTLPPAGSAADRTGGSSAGSAAKQPTVSGVDLTTAVFLQTASLALVEVYKVAEDTGKLRILNLEQARSFARQHREHATGLADFAQSAATDKPNQALVASLTAKVKAAATEKDLLNVLMGIEDSAAATFLWALGEIEDWELAATVATILPVEAQHAVAWSRQYEPDLTTWLFQFDRYVPARQDEAARFDPAQFPTTPAGQFPAASAAR